MLRNILKALISLKFITVMTLSLSGCDIIQKALYRTNAQEVCKDANVVSKLKEVAAHEIYRKSGGLLISIFGALFGLNPNTIIENISQSLVYEKLIEAKYEKDDTYSCKAALKLVGDKKDTSFVIGYNVVLYKDLNEYKFKVSINSIETENAEKKVEVTQTTQSENITSATSETYEHPVGSGSEEQTIKETVVSYHNAVAEERIQDALDYYVSYRKPQIKIDKLTQIAEGTEYYVVEEVKVLNYHDGGRKADVYVRVRQKPVHSPNEQVWEGVWLMEKEGGEWKIIRTPGKRIR